MEYLDGCSTARRRVARKVSQISYLLVVIPELSGVSEVQYKEIIMSSINKDN